MQKQECKSKMNKQKWAEVGGICSHCGRVVPVDKRTLDHFVPKSVGGNTDHRNLIPLCKKCNGCRQSKYINPWKYYKYASSQMIRECLEYKKEWLEQYRTLDGSTWQEWENNS